MAFDEVDEFFQKRNGFFSRIPIDGWKGHPIFEDLCAWHVVVNDKGSMLALLMCKPNIRCFLGIPSLLEAARRSGATTLYSEDLSNGQQVGGMAVFNPFET